MFVVDEVGISLVIVVGSSLSINCVNTCGIRSIFVGRCWVLLEGACVKIGFFVGGCNGESESVN